MPRAARSSEEVEAVKEGIVQSAMEILVEEGFDNLTMEKVGTRMNMTAANLYKYFVNKMDLFREIHKRTFDLLYAKLSRSYGPQDGPLERVVKMIEGYVRFGMEYPNYYEAMFNVPTPKYTDFIGTQFEEVALEERRNAMKLLDLVVGAVEELVASRPRLRGIDAKTLALRYWCTLHGLVSLHINRFIEAVGADTERLATKMIEEMLRQMHENAGEGAEA
ncbi:MAG: TetR/AcrR family transcriptional regulator [Actinobacteria bacterium]|nr:TetR/AcrR family transcriptional regulator [Actinomycetota bacterium]